jgi:sodium transport system permease protein
MNLPDVWTVFRKDWLQTLRDRNTLIIMLVGVLTIPVGSTGAAVIAQNYRHSAAEREARLAVYGDDAQWVVSQIPRTKHLTCEVENRALELKQAVQHATARGAMLISLPAGFRNDIEENAKTTPVISLYIDDRRDTITERMTVDTALDDWRSAIVKSRMPNAEVSSSRTDDFKVDVRSLASNADRTGATIGIILPMELTLAILLLSLYSATELLTAERERGTLVLLAVSPPSRRDILVGKTLVVLLTVLLGSLIGVAVQLGLLAMFVRSLGDMAGQYPLTIPFAGSLLVLPIALPLIIFLTGLSIAVGAFVRNFQQAQSYASVLLIVCLMPSVAAMLPTTDYPPIIAIVPIANTALAIRDVLSGQLTWQFASICMLSSCLYAGLSLFVGTRLLDSEHAVFPQDEPLGAWRTSSRLLILFLAGVFLSYFVIGQSMQSADILIGLIVSQATIIAAPVIFFLRWLRLSVRDVLSLHRPTSWLALPGAALLAPLTVLLACGIMVLQDFVLPMPKALDEMLMQVLLPPGKPMWLVFAAVAAAPAICEEILFRGCVQGILIRSLPPRVVLPLTALGFGLFHMSSFRLLPTGILGLMLCFLTYRFRSIFPSMILHFCHNSLSVIVGVYHLNPFAWQNVIGALATGSIGLLLLWRADKRAV